MDGFERRPEGDVVAEAFVQKTTNIFAMSDKPIVEADWAEQYHKTRHGLDSDKHVMVVETVLLTDDEYPEYDEERTLEIEHPATCPDDAACEFDDFEHDNIDDQKDGRFFVSLHGSIDYFGEYDEEFTVHGPVPDA